MLWGIAKLDAVETIMIWFKQSRIFCKDPKTVAKVPGLVVSPKIKTVAFFLQRQIFSLFALVRWNNWAFVFLCVLLHLSKSFSSAPQCCGVNQSTAQKRWFPACCFLPRRRKHFENNHTFVFSAPVTAECIFGLFLAAADLCNKLKSSDDAGKLSFDNQSQEGRTRTGQKVHFWCGILFLRCCFFSY